MYPYYVEDMDLSKLVNTNGDTCFLVYFYYKSVFNYPYPNDERMVVMHDSLNWEVTEFNKHYKWISTMWVSPLQGSVCITFAKQGLTPLPVVYRPFGTLGIRYITVIPRYKKQECDIVLWKFILTYTNSELRNDWITDNISPSGATYHRQWREPLLKWKVR